MSRTSTIAVATAAGLAITAVLIFLLPGRDLELAGTAHPGLEMWSSKPDGSPWVPAGKLAALGVVLGVAAVAARWNVLVSAIPAVVLGIAYAVWLGTPDGSWSLDIIERAVNPVFPFAVGTLVFVSAATIIGWPSRGVWPGRRPTGR